MNLEFKDNINEEEFNQFTYMHPNGTFFQTSNWAGVKAEWNPLYTGVYADDQLVGVCLVLKRTLFLNTSLLYAPRGPVLDFAQPEILTFYLQELQKLAKKHKAISLTIDPYIIRAEYPMTDAMADKVDCTYDDHLLKVFEEQQYKHTGFVLDLRDSFQPRFTPYIDLSDEASFKKSRGYREGEKALKKDVQIYRGGLEATQRLHDMISLTEDYKNINLRGVEYFDRLVNEYGDDCLITIAYIDFELGLQNAKDRLKDLVERLDNPTLKEGRRREYENQQRVFEKDIAFMSEQLEKHKQKDIAALIGLKNGTKSELLYAGMDRDFQKYAGSYVNYVDAINWSHEKGLSLVSFGGNSGRFNHGIDKFKVGFDPIVTEYLGEFTYVNKPMTNYLFTKALAMKRK